MTSDIEEFPATLLEGVLQTQSGIVVNYAFHIDDPLGCSECISDDLSALVRDYFDELEDDLDLEAQDDCLQEELPFDADDDFFIRELRRNLEAGR
jgi:hypothetical protein